MFVEKSFFDGNQQQNEYIPPRPTSSQGSTDAINTRQKLAQRRKLIASKHKTRGTIKRKIITKTNVLSHTCAETTNHYNIVSNKDRDVRNNSESNRNRSNSIMFGLSDHKNNRTQAMNSHKNNNSSLSSPSQHSKEDSIQNIQIIDNHTIQSITSRSSSSSSNTNTAITEIDDVYKFLTSSVPKNKMIQTYIMRNKSGISNRLFPSYCVYLKDTKNLLMYAKKKQKNRTSNYIITTDSRNCDKNEKTYLGKVRGNFVGTEFAIYDKGRSPKEASNTALTHRKLRSELGSVLYDTNILGTKGPRKMTILLPKLQTVNTSKWQQTDIKSSSSSSMLVSTYKQNDTKLSDNLLLVLNNKSPKWNENIGAYVLNFNGRVTMASVKNFQLVFPNNNDEITLQFGRVGKDRFTMDVKYPLTPLQAFAICLTSFDNKLACE